VIGSYRFGQNRQSLQVQGFGPPVEALIVVKQRQIVEAGGDLGMAFTECFRRRTVQELTPFWVQEF
jgi:hypothetical protein